jgi:hypothetical protein
MLREANEWKGGRAMRPIMRVVATLAVVAAAAGGGATVANAQPVTAQGQGEVACGYDFDSCWAQWYQYGFVKNYIVSKIYYKGGGYHFFWWS